MGSDWREVETFWFDFPLQHRRSTKKSVGEHFSYNFLVENETTAHVKMIRKQNKLLCRDTTGFLTLARLVSGDRADFR